MIFNELKTIWRAQKRNKSIAFINLLGLTIGIASVVTITAFVVSELNRGKEVPNAQNIYRIEMDSEFGHFALNPYPLGNYLKENFSEVTDFVNVRPGNFMGSNDLNTFESGNEKYLVKNILYADSTYFKIFRHKAIAGDVTNALKKTNGIVLTESESVRIFGDKDPIGKTVKFNNNLLLEVEAVIKDIPNDALNYFQIVVNSKLINDGKRWDYLNFFCYFQLSPGADLAKLEKETARVLNERTGKEIKMDFTGKVSFVPYTRLYFYKPSIIDHIKHGSFQTAMVFISVSLLILLIAVINFINLSFAQSMQKAKEIGIRQISGSSRKRIFLMFVSESIIVTSVSFLMAMAVLKVVSLLTTTYDTSAIMNILYSPAFICTAFAGAILTGSIAGIFPGIRMLRLNSVQILKGQKPRQNSKEWFKLGLTSVQFIIAIALLVAIITVNKQIRFIEKKDLGFEKEDLVYFQFENTNDNKGRLLSNKLIQYPAIKSFCLTDGLPGVSLSRNGSELVHNGEKNQVKYMFMRSDYRYISTMGMKIVQGRDFRDGDKDVMIINESAAHSFGIKTLDEQTTLDKKIIVGIVRDFQIESLHQITEPLVIIMEPWTKYGIVRISSGDQAAIQEATNNIKSTWSEIFNDAPLEIHFVNQSMDMMYQKEQMFRIILNILVFLAMFISCIGLFGVSLYLINARIKEIGIRKVNGARISEVMAMLNRDFVKWVAIAFVFATPIAYFAMSKWLENFAYKTNLSWWIFALAGLLALGIALLTVSWQSWKAATRNPVEALRYE